MDSPTTKKHVYVIKQRCTVDLANGPFEYEELVGKCTCPDDVQKILEAHPGAYVSDESAYGNGDLYLFGD